MLLPPHVRRVLSALALLGSASASGCIVVGGGACSVEGQPCTSASVAPSGDSCCFCYTLGASTDASAEGGAADAGAASGTWQNRCVGGPLAPPELA